MNIPQDQLYRSLQESSADGIIVTGVGGGIAMCNPSFARLIGRVEPDLVGQPLSTFVECIRTTDDCTADGGVLSEPCQSLATADNINIHNATISGPGGIDMIMPVSHACLKRPDGQPLGYLSVVYIIQAGSVQQAQTEFVSTVSHELRTPLTSIKGFADTILRAGDRLDVSQQRRYVGIIKDQADRLTRLVEDLLAVSRLESRKMQLTIRALDLEDAIQRVLRNLADRTQEHHINISAPRGLPPVWADADRLEQILTNLIDNAIKYSPGATTVNISVRPVSAQTEMVEFSVSDQGVGIPPDHLPEIFNKFSRLDNPLVRQTEGTGLGLYITRSLVLALGGQIHAESNSNGTTFTVRLPAATLEEQAARGRG